jgi:hypothetical protein
MAGGVEGDEVRDEVVGRAAVLDGWWRIAGDASDGALEKGMALLTVPFLSVDELF